uniref:Uncharacterized protein n=1 Tax=Utricularia reniformis TaxID=192314 RepID=A0A1Y0AZG2_9LAMI|nr:hypothetical protein AEK19_MT0253 [Utricularia reniformis]ART30530.1 hypothetical protein AEK19_MT0253 [Utricularia reniformis]
MIRTVKTARNSYYCLKRSVFLLLGDSDPGQEITTFFSTPPWRYSVGLHTYPTGENAGPESGSTIGGKYSYPLAAL